MVRELNPQPSNENAKTWAGLANDRWDSYNDYEQALVDLEYKVESRAGDALLRLSETGPAQTAIAKFDINKLGLGGRVHEGESVEEILLRDLGRMNSDVIPAILTSDNVSTESVTVDGHEGEDGSVLNGRIEIEMAPSKSY